MYFNVSPLKSLTKNVSPTGVPTRYWEGADRAASTPKIVIHQTRFTELQGIIRRIQNRVVRNGVEDGYTGKHVKIETHLTEPQGKIKKWITMLVCLVMILTLARPKRTRGEALNG